MVLPHDVHRLLLATNSKGNQLEAQSPPYHTEKRSRRATPEIFGPRVLLASDEELWCLDSMDDGQFHSRRESSRRTTHALRVSVDCLTEYLNTISF